MGKIYKNFHLLDGSKGMTIRDNLMLKVEGDRIVEIGENIAANDGDRVLDLKGGYLMPGLINTHVHLPANGVSKADPERSKSLVKFIKKTPLRRKIGQIFVCNKNVTTELLSGVTTIRTVGGVGNIDSNIKKDVESGRLLGPRVLSSDMAVTIPKGHMEGTVAEGMIEIQDFVNFVNSNIDSGVDWIKIMITGGVLDAKLRGFPGEMRMNAEQVKACCDTAHARGVKVCAHVESPEGVIVAAQCGVDTIEHGSDMEAAELNALIENDAALICTISPAVCIARLNPDELGVKEMVQYNSEVLMQSMIKGTKKCLEVGVKVGLGTDTGCPYITHYDMWRELEYFHLFCDVSREDALYAATLSNATILGIDKETGSIEEGKIADFIVSKTNPLEGFEALRELEMVVHCGKEIAKPKVDKFPACEKALDSLLKELREMNP